MKNKKIRIAVKITLFMLIVLVIITTAITGFKLIFGKDYRRPVPISPFMFYGQGVSDSGEQYSYHPRMTTLPMR